MKQSFSLNYHDSLKFMSNFIRILINHPIFQSTGVNMRMMFFYFCHDLNTEKENIQ